MPLKTNNLNNIVNYLYQSIHPDSVFLRIIDSSGYCIGIPLFTVFQLTRVTPITLVKMEELTSPLQIYFVLFVFIHYIITVYLYLNKIMRCVLQARNDKGIFGMQVLVKITFDKFVYDEGNSN